MSRRLAIAFSSGDLIADRRLQMAREYAMAGGYAAAAELTEQALELMPTWPAGWFALGEFHEAAADEAGAEAGAAARAAAIGAFVQARRLDPDDRCGAGLRLARLGADRAPDAPPTAHVRDLFDGYADRFDTSLVTGLGYCGPALLRDALDAAFPGRTYAAALDLGCGTGLMGRELRERVTRLEGVDLSAAMVTKATATGLYDRLTVAEIVADMATRAAASFDLVTAADVLCYVGDLNAVFAGAARIARRGAVLAVTSESLGDDEAGAELVLRDSLRYAHRRSHVEGAATAAGWTTTSLGWATIRRDRGRDIAALVALFTKT